MKYIGGPVWCMLHDAQQPLARMVHCTQLYEAAYRNQHTIDANLGTLPDGIKRSIISRPHRQEMGPDSPFETDASIANTVAVY